MEKYSFTGKRLLITGATGGLGVAMVRKLAAVDARMVVSARSEKALKDLQDSVSNTDLIETIAADISKSEQLKQLAERSLSMLGGIDVLFNVAGLGYFALMEEATDESMRYLFEVNTFAPLKLMQELVPHMKNRGSGRIVNVVTCAGRVPIPTAGVYGGSKSAFAIMANTMRIELEPLGIDILNIYPGTIDTTFEKNALRENERPGICPTDHCGIPDVAAADKVLAAAEGPAGEYWLEREGKWMSVAAIAWPDYVEKRMAPLRDRAVPQDPSSPPPEQRRWRLWQVESAIACNLKCIMCPWAGFRHDVRKGIMAQETWDALRPYLPDVRSIDFTGGGEPLLQPQLVDWMAEAKAAGCEIGFLTNGLLLNRETAQKIIDIGTDWIGFSIDGATKDIYEEIRLGSNFDRLSENIKAINAMRVGKVPMTMINFVIMPSNKHQIEAIVELASKLHVDQVNFKQCDVIRGEDGKGHGLFSANENREIKQLKKHLDKAHRLARKLKINTTAFSFVADEQPVCDQDPRDSLFVRYDGSVAPCINLAIGGPTTFLGESVTMPTVHYGRVDETSLQALWDTDSCRFYRERFRQRVTAYDKEIVGSAFEASMIKLKETFEAARAAMPEAPDGCKVCHYLYDI